MPEIRKVATVADRLREALEKNELRQADLLRMVQPHCERLGITMTRSDISFYCRGKCLPAPNKLTLLAAVLNVSEAWLSGFDVPETPDKTEQLLSELLSFEEGREKENQKIMKQVGINNLAILFWRASESDREAVRQILKKYVDDIRKTTKEQGYLEYVETGLFGLPETRE